MTDPELWKGIAIFTGMRQAHPILLDTAMRLLLLVPGLALELGFYGAVLWVLRSRMLRARQDQPVSTAIYLAVCGLVMVLFVRSAVMTQNDFGYRAAMLPQFFLLLLGTSLVASWRGDCEGSLPIVLTKSARRWLTGLMALGLAGTLYQGVMLRLFLPIEAHHAGSGFGDLPTDAYEARRAFSALDKAASRSAVVQINAVDPTGDPQGDVVPPHQFYVRALLMDSGRQVLNLEPECAIAFGGDTRPCAAIREDTAQLYNALAPTAEWAVEYCGRFGVEYLAVSHIDPAWGDHAGWAWTLPVAEAEPGFRILRCGGVVQ